MDSPNDQRITVSLSTLQAELGKLELRIVDRLNDALSGKADKVVQEQHTRELADMSTRLLSLEQISIKRDGPEAAQIIQNTKDIAEGKNVQSFKRWLWAQTIALVGVAVAAAVAVWQVID